MLETIRSRVSALKVNGRFAGDRLLLVTAKIVVLVTALLILTPVTVFTMARPGLDPSWTIGIQLAKKEGLVFGQDIIFTYGPLGYLATRLPIGIEKWQILLWDAYLMAIIALLLVSVLKQVQSLWAVLLVFLTALAASFFLQRYTSLAPTAVFVLLASLLFLYLRTRKLAVLLLLLTTGLLLFYIKANMGLPALFILAAFLAYLIVFPQGQGRPVLIGVAAVFLVALVISAILVNTNLVGYVLGTVHLASSFNDAMFITPEEGRVGPEYLAMAVFLIAAVAAVVARHAKALIADRDSLVRVAVVVLFLFLVFKHGFVRPSYGRVEALFCLMTVALGLLTWAEAEPLRRSTYRVFLLSLMFSFVFIGPRFTADFLELRWHQMLNYVEMAFADDGFDAVDPSLAQRILPEDALALIGDGAVDVVPWEISYVLANDLGYRPRPVIQSYAAYDDYLDSANAERYRSESGPDFVLFSVGDIDNRHPFFTESKTKVALLSHYAVVLRHDDWLLLERRSQPLELQEEAGETKQARLGQWIDLPEGSGFQTMSADIGYNLIGSLLRTLYHPPLLTVTVQFDDGEERTYRAVKSIVNGEVIVDRFVDSLDAAQLFFQFDGELNRRVRRVRFDVPEDKGYRQDFTYRFKRYVPASKAREVADLPVPLAEGLTLEDLAVQVTSSALTVDLAWRGPETIADRGQDRHYTAYVHVLDGQYRRLAGFDVLLQEDHEGVAAVPGDPAGTYVSHHPMVLPPDLEPGTYHLSVGLYYFDDGELVNVDSITLTDFLRF